MKNTIYTFDRMKYWEEFVDLLIACNCQMALSDFTTLYYMVKNHYPLDKLAHFIWNSSATDLSEEVLLELIIDLWESQAEKEQDKENAPW